MQSFNPLKITIDPPGVQAAKPGETLELHVLVSNQGNQSAVIDVSFDEASQTLNQWCSASQQSLALAPQQTDEVTFQFQIPVQALAGTYNYTLVIDSPNHYPQYTPIQYQRQLKVLLSQQTVIRVNDPTFFLQPTTNPSKPLILKRGEPLDVVVTVDNRSQRVDKFRLTCPDLEENWFTIRYPTAGLQGMGLQSESNVLDLNPTTQGQIRLQIHPPVDALAGDYYPNISLHSANSPDLVLLDVLYIQIPAVYDLHWDLKIILGRVSNSPGRYELRLNNRGNTVRELTIGIKSRDEEDLCTYRCGELSQYLLNPIQSNLLNPIQSNLINPIQNQVFFISRFLNIFGITIGNGSSRVGGSESGNDLSKSRKSRKKLERCEPAEVKLLPNKSDVVNLTVKPVRWWRRPLIGGGLTLNFIVEIQDRENLPIPDNLPQGILVWKPRPWWQLLLLILVILGLVGGCGFIIWKLLHPEPLKLVNFQAVNQQGYTEGDEVRLHWEIDNINQLQKLVLTTTSKDSTPPDPVTYELDGGNLKDSSKGKMMTTECQEEKEKQVITCNNVATGVKAAGTYTFELIANLPEGKTISPQPVVVEVKPKPAPVVEYFYPKSFNIAPGEKVLLNWKIHNFDQLSNLIIFAKPKGDRGQTDRDFYDFRNGIDKKLSSLCAPQTPDLTCTQVPFHPNLKPAASYTFALKGFSQKGQPIETKETEPITILYKPAEIVAFKLNGKDTPNSFSFQVGKTVTLTWEVNGEEGIQVNISGVTVGRKGSKEYTVTKDTSRIYLEVTDIDRKTLKQEFTIIVEPSPSPSPSISPSPPFSSPPILPSSPLSSPIVSPSESPHQSKSNRKRVI